MTAPADLAPVRVLVVDDDDDVRAALVDEMARRYAVDAFAAGDAAIEALAARPYDVVIADLRMPGRDGIDVLERARQLRPGAVRVLLTGHVDERADDALIRAGAPYRVGKPWHDELDILVRHALDDRARGAAGDAPAIDLAELDAALARAESPEEAARVAVVRAAQVDGVASAAAVAGARLCAGTLGRDGGWHVDLPVDVAADLRLVARGDGERARERVTLIAHRAQRRAAVLLARGALGPGPRRARGTRRNELLRRATLGSVTSALLHDLASSMQGLQAAVDALDEIAADVPAVREAAADVIAASHGAVALFLSMRKFLRAGELAMRTAAAASVLDRAARACRNARDGVEVRVGPAPTVEVKVADVLFAQVLADLTRHAIARSPSGGAVDLEAEADDAQVRFTITDDSAGLATGEDELIFEPLASADDGAALGLAVAAHLIELHGGSLAYRRSATRGAVFTIALPRADVADAAA